MLLRIARHTDDLQKIKDFYIGILGFELLGSFENHAGYDGVFIGKPGTGWHLEFTKSEAKANHHPDEDDLLVLYPENQKDCDLLTGNLLSNGIAPIVAKNPYWNQNGKTFKDPDGYRIVISPLQIK